MEVVAKPKEEESILSSVKNDAKAEEIRKSIILKAEHCVDHLCGCE